MPRMCSLNKPGIKHNDYATVTVNTPTQANVVAEFPTQYSMSGYVYNHPTTFQPYSNIFSITVNNRTNGKELFWTISGAGADPNRFYNVFMNSQYYVNPYTGSNSSSNPLYGSHGKTPGVQTIQKQVAASTSNSNPGAAFTATSFTVDIRVGSSTGTILASSQAITCHRWAFWIETYDDVAGNYKAAGVGYTYPAESAIGAPANNRNVYCRVNTPDSTIYNLQALFTGNGYAQMVQGAAGTASTPSVDYYSGPMSQISWFDLPTAYSRPVYSNAIYKDVATEGAETFRYSFIWPNGGTTWAYGPDNTIAANST